MADLMQRRVGFCKSHLSTLNKKGLPVLRLNLSNALEWIDLGHGVRLQVLPLTTPVMTARKAAQDKMALPKASDPGDADSLDTDSIGLAMAKAVARIVVLDWEGVGDADGNPVAVSPEGIDALLDIWPIFDAFQTRYVARAMILDAEKNALPPLLNGNSVGAETIAKPARKAATTARRG
jgi:hypothetical protein